MAKSKVNKKKRGPYLAAAFFCETVVEDKHDSTLSAIRIIDSLTIQLDQSTPAEFPSDTNRLPVPITAILSFKTGDSPGKHTVRIAMESPSGKTAHTTFEKTLEATEPPHGGFNIRINNVIFVKKGGLFWFHVFLDGKRVTRMPFMINVERMQAPLLQPADAPSPAPNT